MEIVYCLLVAVCICANRATADHKPDNYDPPIDHELKEYDYPSLGDIETPTGESKTPRDDFKWTYPEVLEERSIPSRFGLDFENSYDFEGEDRSYGFEKAFAPESLERSNGEIGEVSEDLRKVIGLRGHRESTDLLHALTGERDELAAIKYLGDLIGTKDHLKIHEFIRRCRGSRSWKFVIDFMLLMEGKTNLSVIVELLRELTGEEDVFKAFDSLRPLIGHADFDGIFEILEKISGERDSHGVADYFKHVGHTSGVEGVRVEVSKLTGGKGPSEFPKVLKMFMTEVDMRGAFNILMSATRTGGRSLEFVPDMAIVSPPMTTHLEINIGDAILEFTQIMNVDSFAEAVSLMRNVTKQPQLKYALEELLHAVHRRSLRTTAADVYRICGVDNFEDATEIMSKIFESDNIVSAAQKINRVTKRLDPLYFLSVIIGVTQTENLVEADAAIRKLTNKPMSLLDILEKIRISSRQSNVMEFFRRFITSTGTRNIQQAWEIIARITSMNDIFVFFDMVEKYTEVDVLVFLETILKVTNTPNISEASTLLNKVCKNGSAPSLFEIIEEISTITKMDVVKFFEQFITLSNRFYFEEAVTTVQKFTETSNFIDALADLRRATGQPDIPRAIEYIKQNKPRIPRTTTTEQPEVTTRDHTNDNHSFDTKDMSNNEEDKLEFAHLPKSDFTTELLKQPDKRPEQTFKQPNLLPAVIIERQPQPEPAIDPIYKEPTVIIDQESNPLFDSDLVVEDLIADVRSLKPIYQSTSDMYVPEYNTQTDVSEFTIDGSEYTDNSDASSSRNQDIVIKTGQETSTSVKQDYDESTTDKSNGITTEETFIKISEVSSSETSSAQEEYVRSSLVTTENSYRDYGSDWSEFSADHLESILSSDAESSTLQQDDKNDANIEAGIQKGIKKLHEEVIASDNLESTEKSEFESSTVRHESTTKATDEKYISDKQIQNNSTRIDRTMTDEPDLSTATETSTIESEIAPNKQVTEKEGLINPPETTEKNYVNSTSTEKTTTEQEITSETSKVSTISENKKEQTNHESNENFNESEFDSSISESSTYATDLSDNVQVTESSESTTTTPSGYSESTQETSIKEYSTEISQGLPDDSDKNVESSTTANVELNQSNVINHTEAINSDIQEETNEESFDKSTEDHQEHEGTFIDTSSNYEDNTWVYENLVYNDESSSSVSSDTDSTLLATKYYDETTASIIDSNYEVTSSDEPSPILEEMIEDITSEKPLASEDIIIKDTVFDKELSDHKLASTEKTESTHASSSLQSSTTESTTDENKYEEGTIEDTNLKVETALTNQEVINKSDQTKSYLEPTTEMTTTGDFTSEIVLIAENTNEDIPIEASITSDVYSTERTDYSSKSTTETAKTKHDETTGASEFADYSNAEEQTSTTEVISDISKDDSISKSAEIIEDKSNGENESIENQFTNEDINNNDALFSSKKSEANRKEKESNYEDVVIENAAEENKSYNEDNTTHDATKLATVEVLINKVESNNGDLSSNETVTTHSVNILKEEVSDATELDLFNKETSKEETSQYHSFDEVTIKPAVTEGHLLSYETTESVNQSSNVETEEHNSQEDTNKVVTNPGDLITTKSASLNAVDSITDKTSIDRQNMESPSELEKSSDIYLTITTNNQDVSTTDAFSSDKTKFDAVSSQFNKELKDNYEETNVENTLSDEKVSIISSGSRILDTIKENAVNESDSAIRERADDDFSSTELPSVFDDESSFINGNISTDTEIVGQLEGAISSMDTSTKTSSETEELSDRIGSTFDFTSIMKKFLTEEAKSVNTTFESSKSMTEFNQNIETDRNDGHSTYKGEQEHTNSDLSHVVINKDLSTTEASSEITQKKSSMDISDLISEQTISIVDNYDSNEEIVHIIDTTNEAKLVEETFVSGESTTESNKETTKDKTIKPTVDGANESKITGEFYATTKASESMFKEINKAAEQQESITTEEATIESDDSPNKIFEYDAIENQELTTMETALLSEIKGSNTDFDDISTINEVTFNSQSITEKYTLTGNSEDSSTNEFVTSSNDSSPITEDSVFESPTLIQESIKEFVSNSETDVTSEDSSIFDTSNISSEEYITDDSSILTSEDSTWNHNTSQTVSEDTTSSTIVSKETSKEMIEKENSSDKSKLTDVNSKSDNSNLSSYVSPSLEYSNESEYPAKSDYTETSIETYDVEQESISTDQPLTTKQPELKQPTGDEKENKAKEHTDKQQVATYSVLADNFSNLEQDTFNNYEIKQSNFTDKLSDTANQVIDKIISITPDQLAFTAVAENLKETVELTSDSSNTEYVTSESDKQSTTTENVYDTVASTSKSYEYEESFTTQDTTESTLTAENVYDSVASTSESSNAEIISEKFDVKKSASSTENVYSSVMSMSGSNEGEFAKNVTSEKSDITQSASSIENVYDSVASTPKSSTIEYGLSETSDSTHSFSSSDNVYDSVPSTSETSDTEYVTTEKSDATQSISNTENIYDSVKSTSEDNNQEYEESFSSTQSDTVHNPAENLYDTSVSKTAESMRLENEESFTFKESPLFHITENQHDSMTKSYVDDNEESTTQSSDKSQTDSTNSVSQSKSTSSNTEQNSPTSDTIVTDKYNVDKNIDSTSDIDTDTVMKNKKETETKDILVTGPSTIDFKEIPNNPSITEKLNELQTKFESDQTKNKSIEEIESFTKEASTQSESLEQPSNYTETESTVVESVTKPETDQTKDETTIEIESSTKEATTKSESLEQATESTIIESVTKSKTDQTNDESTEKIKSSTKKASTQSKSPEQATESSIVESEAIFEPDETNDESTVEIESSTKETATQSDSLELTSDYTVTESTVLESVTKSETSESSNKSTVTTKGSYIDSSTSTESLERISDQITEITEISTSKSTEIITSEQDTTSEVSPIDSSSNSELQNASEQSLLETESSTVESSKSETIDQIFTENSYIDTTQSSRENNDQSTDTYVSKSSTIETSTKSESLELINDYTEIESANVESAINTDTVPSIISMETDLLLNEEIFPPQPPGSYVPSTEVEITSSGGKLALNQGKKEIMDALEANMNLKVLILPNGPEGNNCFCTCENSSPRLVPYSDLPKIPE